MNYDVKCLCRICRTELFTSNEFHEHSLTNVNSNKCTSLFLTEPPNNTTTTIVGVDISNENGKLYCFKCNNRLGSWSWVGNKCSCGLWMVPNFQIIKSKVDLVNIDPSITDNSVGLVNEEIRNNDIDDGNSMLEVELQT
eukprot:gene10439-14022_t